MERATKLFLIGWACAAIAVEAWLLRGGWRGLPLLTLGAFAAGALLAMWDRRAVGLVLVFAYLFPAIVRIGHGQYHSNYGILWASALLGAVAPDGLRTSWHIPARWRGALVCWALVVAFGAPIVMGREFDFNLVLLMEERMPTSALGSVPGFVVVWVAQVALTLVLGVLWFDWLFGASDLDLHAWIVTPLAMSALAMASVAIYQLFGDVSFLNETVYGNMGRASGTMLDANVCGTIAALWIGGTAVWAQRLGRWRPYLLIVGPAATWLAVWASGSRTAFAAAVLVTAFSLATQYAARGNVPRKSAVPRVLLAASLVMALLVLLANADLAVEGPVKRVRDTLPELSAGSVRAFAVEMWNRNRYGSAASAMIRESPFFGVGVGSFHFLVSHFAALSPDDSLPPDNAQNWYRHQLAEVGLIGSVGWIVWVVLFAGFVLKRHASSPPAAWTVRGMLLTFAMISLVGMPGQEVSVTITFWTMAFWYVSLVGAPPNVPVTKRTWAAVLAVSLIFAAGTAYLAVSWLRVASRAQRSGSSYGGSSYSYGFYYPEPDGSGGVYRWARQRAAIVIDAPTRVLIITVWVNHSDIATRPVDVKVWRDGDLVIETTLRDGARATAAVLLPSREKRVVLDTWVSRVVRPADVGVADSRELGLMVKWEFVSQLPATP